MEKQAISNQRKRECDLEDELTALHIRCRQLEQILELNNITSIEEHIKTFIADSRKFLKAITLQAQILEYDPTVAKNIDALLEYIDYFRIEIEELRLR